MEAGLPRPPFVESSIDAGRQQPATVKVARVNKEGTEELNPPAEELQVVPSPSPQTASFAPQLAEEEKAWKTVAHSGSKEGIVHRHQARTVTAVGVVGKQPRALKQPPSHKGPATDVQDINWDTSGGRGETTCSVHASDPRRAISTGFQCEETRQQQGLDTDFEKTHVDACGAATPSGGARQLQLTGLRPPDDDSHEVKSTTSVITPRGKNNPPIDTVNRGALMKRDTPAARDTDAVVGNQARTRNGAARACETGYRSGRRTESKEQVCATTSYGVFAAALSCSTPALDQSLVGKIIDAFIADTKIRDAVVVATIGIDQAVHLQITRPSPTHQEIGDP